MKHLVNCVCFFLLAFQLQAQEKHFIFIQSENRQPFYVSLNGKIYSSTAAGYVIVPKLQEGEYNFTIGFAPGSQKEQAFRYTITNKDAGFTLKNFGEKGWGLFNLQSLAVTMADEMTSNLAVSKPRAKDDTPISFEKKPVQKPDTVQSIVSLGNTMTVIVGSNVLADTSSGVAVKDQQRDSLRVAKETGINKLSETSAAEKLSLVYEDSSGKNKDTIQVIIPLANDIVINDSVAVKPTTETNTDVKRIDSIQEVTRPKRDDIKFLQIDSVKAEVVNTKEPVILNSNCKAQATEDDYTRLRRKMAQEATDEKMMSEANRFYQRKCFSTAQVKALSTLFLSDEGRYNFFVSSLNFVTDPDQFESLSTEFIDPQFSSQFKSFLNK
jgi:hypothetical protein